MSCERIQGRYALVTSPPLPRRSFSKPPPRRPKSTDAARFLLQEAGLSDARQQPATPAEAVGDILRELAAVAREIADATRRDDADIVDGTATTHSDDDDGDGDGTRTTAGVG